MLGKEDFVSFQTAKKLHEKGYSGVITASTLYEVQIWLISKGLFVNVQYFSGNYFNYEILTIPKHDLICLHNPILHYCYNSYQSALSAGIDEALNLI